MKRSLCALVLLVIMLFPCACSQGKSAYTGPLAWNELTIEDSMDLKYATQFKVDYLSEGYILITIADSEKYLLIPEGKEIPTDMDNSIRTIQMPIKNTYLASTSAMDLVRAVDAMSCIRFTGLKAEDWYIESAKNALLDGSMSYVGKYNAPDYEYLIANDCELAIENTMILHNPEVKEKLEQIDIPVIVERSSYEGHPLGRLEWVKLYGVLFGKEKEANAFYEEQLNLVENILVESKQEDGPVIVFFYITSNGLVSVRKSGDYISEMIILSGGNIIAWDEEADEENALSTMTIQMESFYNTAKDADYIIYNSSIDSEIYDLDVLLEKSPLLADFKAVQNGHVWGTGKNMFQESTSVAPLMLDINSIITNPDIEDSELSFLHRIK